MKIPTFEQYYNQKQRLEDLIHSKEGQDDGVAYEAKHLLRNIESNIETQMQAIEYGAGMQIAYAKDMLKAHFKDEDNKQDCIDYLIIQIGETAWIDDDTERAEHVKDIRQRCKDDFNV